MMKGSIDILLLSVIAREAMYGYAIVQALKASSNDIYEMSEGTLYPALKRLENKGFLDSFWGDSQSGGRRKYYRITEQGLKELAKKLAEWEKVNRLISKCTEGLAWKNLKPISNP